MKTEKKRNKVFLVLKFNKDTDECKVKTVHASEEKAQERAEHLRNQYPSDSVSVIRKTLLGKL